MKRQCPEAGAGINQFAFVSFARFVSALPVTIGASMTAASRSGEIDAFGSKRSLAA